MGWSQIKALLRRPEWWIRAALPRHIHRDAYGEPSFEALLNGLVRDTVRDVAIVAADILITENLNAQKPFRQINRLSQFSLKSAGLIGNISSRDCPVADSMLEVLGEKVSGIRWKTVVGSQYRMLLKKAVRWRGYVEADATAWVNISDTINDLLLDVLFRHDTRMGTYQLGNIGSVLTQNNRLHRNYPMMFKASKIIHERRLESDLSHPITKATGKITRRIRFQELRGLKKVLANGYAEVWRKWW